MISTAAKAYRSLLRIIPVALRNESKSQIEHAKRHCRNLFDANKSETNHNKIDKMIKNAVDCELLLKRNVVFAEKKDGDTFVLEFTKDTEIGDNDTIKKNHKCCSH